MPTASLQANAKVNLTLDLLGLRPDGYHELRSVVAPVELHDDISVFVPDSGADGRHAIPETWEGGTPWSRVEPDEDGAPGIFLATVPDGVDCSGIGPASDNLCVKAVRRFFRRLPPDSQFRRRAEAVAVGVVKRIPLGGGLGGGSADAAATLRALNRLAGGEALGGGVLAEVGAEVGSDVPALLDGGVVLMEGRGERVTPLDISFRPMSVLLANCGTHVSTGRAYAESDRCRNAGGEGSRAGIPHGSCIGIGELAQVMRNDLEAPVFSFCPEVAETAKRLRDAGARAVMMSGSGATVLALAEDDVAAATLAAALDGAWWRRITRFKAPAAQSGRA